MSLSMSLHKLYTVCSTSQTFVAVPVIASTGDLTRSRSSQIAIREDHLAEIIPARWKVHGHGDCGRGWQGNARTASDPPSAPQSRLPRPYRALTQMSPAR